MGKLILEANPVQRILPPLLSIFLASLLLFSGGIARGTRAAPRPEPIPEPPAAQQPPAPGPEARLALEQVNRYRIAAGLPPVAYDPALGAAAQAHAAYLAANPDQWEPNAHTEVPGAPGFTGRRPADRAARQGYGGGVGEIVHFAGPAEQAVDGWMQTLYHRLPLLSPRTTAIGYGFAAGPDGRYVNVLDYGVAPAGAAARSVTGPQEAVAWPHPGQTGVPTAWDGREVPDPFRLHPGVEGPVGYTITLTFPGPVRSLRLTEASLTGPEGRVPVLPFDPEGDDRLSDTAALIPARPLRPDSRYTVRMRGLVDRGQGPEPFERTWSFTTGPESRPARVQSVTTWLDGIRLAGEGFRPEMAVYAAGLPVEGLQVADDRSATFRLPACSPDDAAELLVVSPDGSETAVPLFAWCDRRTGKGEPFRPVPLQVAGAALDRPALMGPGGTILLPESALSALGAQAEPAPDASSALGRTYWSLGGRLGLYTPGRVMAWVAGERLQLALPVQEHGGAVYVDKSFLERLAAVEARLVNGTLYVDGF